LVEANGHVASDTKIKKVWIVHNMGNDHHQWIWRKLMKFLISL